MQKKYIAKRDLSLSIRLKSGKGMHISFASQTGGGSVYYSSDAEVQKALENHAYFQRLYTMEEIKEVSTPKKEKTSVSDEAAKSNSVRYVACMDDAKDILSDEFGIGRSKLKTQAQVDEAAKQVGIVFETKK